MKIAVLGLWHLGCVTAACCAKHFEVVGLAQNAAELMPLQRGKAPLFEPGLDDLLQAGIESGRLRFTADAKTACADADILWVTYDTPVDENDRADVDSVLGEIRRCVPSLPHGALVLLSSQLPVGTCRLLESEFAVGNYRIACSPENLRLGKAIDVFTRADRIIAGVRDERSKAQLTGLFAPFTQQIIWMRPASAEMTKHAINSFLALSITFMNEVARLCEATGADANEVERGLKSESRIGAKAYLSPGGAFAGGTLARDVVTLTQLGTSGGKSLEVLPAIKRSNDRHRGWAFDKICEEFGEAHGEIVSLLGLTYKPGTNTLRRSSAVELAHALHSAGFAVRAFDPSNPPVPSDLSFLAVQKSPQEATAGADAVVVCTEWPDFQQLDWQTLIAGMRRPLIIDASRFLRGRLDRLPGLRYVAVGSPS